MTTPQPRWSNLDDDTADLLTLVADPHPIVGADAADLFLAACRRDAMAHDGLVSVNRVAALLADSDIPPRRYSALWAHHTGEGRPMVHAGQYETRDGSASGNNGKPMRLRRWVGAR